MAKLKVFRTPIGFHDAYVAAASQKAALEAWGADADLFARGVAERITDQTLMDEPLKRPGEIIRVVRGSDRDHFRELAKSSVAVPRKAVGKGHETPSPRRATAPTNAPPPKRKAPRPSRAALDQAEAALEGARADYQAQLREIADQEAALKQRRRALADEQEARMARLEANREKARTNYQREIEKWATR